MALSDRLKKIPLFSELGDDEREYLASALAPRTLTPLEPLFWVGDSGDDMFFIERGKVEICIPDHGGKEIRLAVLGPGDFLGEISLLDGGSRTATARAIGEVELLSLNRQDFHNCITRFPAVALKVVTILSARQRSTVEKLRGIRNLNEVMDQTLTPWQKLANTIAGLASSSAFLMTHAIAFGGWIAVNLALGAQRALDPFPFPFLCFWSSCEAIFLSMFILISQAQQGQTDRIRNEVEYQIALKLQLEMMQLHRKMDEQAVLLARRDEEEAAV